jgi:DivIVA domain-containing protein
VLTPEEIQSREFLVSLRGYDRDEVHAFLDRVAEHVRELQGRLGGPESGAGPVPAAAEQAGDTAEMFAKIGQETHRILEAAHEAGAAIKRTARQEADRDLQAARAEAARVIADGERRREAVEELVAGLEAARDQLAGELRQVGRTIESSLRDLLGDDTHTASVREALAAEALPDDAEPPEPVGQLVAVAEAEDAASEDVGGGGAEQDMQEGPHGARQAVLSELHLRLVRQIKRGLHDVQNVVLDRLRRADGQGDLEALLPTDDELIEFSTGVAELLEEAYKAGRANASTQLGRELPPPEQQRELVEAFLDDAADRIRGGLAAHLRMGLESGEDLSTLSARVSGVFGEIKQATTDEWADIYLVRDFELGQLDAWAAGGITHREWVVGQEPRCPEGRCRQNGQHAVQAIGTVFPTGHEAPPVHAGCTCTTVPVIESPDSVAAEAAP